VPEHRHPQAVRVRPANMDQQHEFGGLIDEVESARRPRWVLYGSVGRGNERVHDLPAFVTVVGEATSSCPASRALHCLADA
jgi:hypothetical protein